MFDKVMAAVGIGNAQVDTRLSTDAVRSGEILEGEIHIRGGKVSQEISGLVLDLISEVIKEVNDKKVRVPHTWARLALTEPMTIAAGQSEVVPFSLDISLLSPLSIGRQQPKTWVATRADIGMAIDPRDRDALTIRPGVLHENLFNAMKSLGFKLNGAPLEATRRNPATGCIQEFEFKPSRNGRFSHLDEAELAFLPSQQGALDLLIQRDTKARGLGSLLAEMSGSDETFYRATLQGDESQAQLEGLLAQALA